MTQAVVPTVFEAPETLGRLRPGPRRPGVDVDAVQRSKLVSSLVHVAATKGYAQTTVGDITARARVSRRTFYEHFRDKEACLTDAFATACATLMDFVRQEVRKHREAPWQERLAVASDAYLRAVAYSPDVSRMFFTEHLACGEDALRRAREVKLRWAAFIREEIEFETSTNPALAPTVALPGEALARAGVAGAYELSLMLLEPGTTLTPDDLLLPALQLFLGIHSQTAHVAAEYVRAAVPTGDFTARASLEEARLRAGFSARLVDDTAPV